MKQLDRIKKQIEDQKRFLKVYEVYDYENMPDELLRQLASEEYEIDEVMKMVEPYKMTSSDPNNPQVRMGMREDGFTIEEIERRSKYYRRLQDG